MRKLANLSILVIVSLMGCLAVLAPAFCNAAALESNIEPRVTQIEAPKNVLFIGNSFTFFNDHVGVHFYLLTIESDKPNAKSYIFGAMTIPGAHLSDHVYGIQAIADPFNKKTNLSRKWDIVVLQGHSQEPIDSKKSDEFKATARDFDMIIRNSGAKTAFFMTWGYGDNPEDMTRQLRNAYTQIGNELNALVVPVGLAFERALKERPGAAMFKWDKKHPSLMGTYLAACVFYSAFYNRSPVGNKYTAGLDKTDAEFLQNVAWNSVKGFYGR